MRHNSAVYPERWKRLALHALDGYPISSAGEESLRTFGFGQVQKTLKWSLVVASAALFVGGCVGTESSDSKPEANTAAAGENPGGEGKKLAIGMVFDSGGIGDKSFNDSANRGLERAKAELGVDVRTIDSKSEKDYTTNLSTLAEQGCDLVFAVGITQQNALTEVAENFPKTKFAIVDAVVEKENVRSLLFSEEQGSYLAGYLAGMTSKSGKLGFVGGKDIPLIKKFEVGYAAGAKAANPKIEMLPAKYTDSWDDTNLGKQIAQVLFSQGADIVYHASGRCGVGVIQAAKEAGKMAIGVDSDQDDLAPGFVLTSMIKKVDEAVFSSIKDLKEGKFEAGSKIYDLKSKGVGISELKFTKDKLPEGALVKLSQVGEDIVSGKIVVPSK